MYCIGLTLNKVWLQYTEILVWIVYIFLLYDKLETTLQIEIFFATLFTSCQPVISVAAESICCPLVGNKRNSKLIFNSQNRYNSSRVIDPWHDESQNKRINKLLLLPSLRNTTGDKFVMSQLKYLNV